MLTMIGLGLQDGDISRNGVQALAAADVAYAELYTNEMIYDLDALETETGTTITVLDRATVEEEDRVVHDAEETDVAFLVSGDPLAATTHQDILFRAQEQEIQTRVVHAPSILTAVAETGLSLYRFGRTTTITVMNDTVPDSVWDAIEENRERGLHTLVLLDIGMDPGEAVSRLADRVDSLVVCSRLGTGDARIVAGEPDVLPDRFETPAAIVVPGDLGDYEADRLQNL